MIPRERTPLEIKTGLDDVIIQRALDDFTGSVMRRIVVAKIELDIERERATLENIETLPELRKTQAMIRARRQLIAHLNSSTQ